MRSGCVTNFMERLSPCSRLSHGYLLGIARLCKASVPGRHSTCGRMLGWEAGSAPVPRSGGPRKLDLRGPVAGAKTLEKRGVPRQPRYTWGFGTVGVVSNRSRLLTTPTVPKLKINRTQVRSVSRRAETGRTAYRRRLETRRCEVVPEIPINTRCARGVASSIFLKASTPQHAPLPSL